jgi:two-component system, OmpR family, sensor histidine kinase MprB
VTLRARLALLVAAAVAAAVVVASVATFLVTRAELRRQVDQSLLQFAEQPERARFLRQLERLRGTTPISLPQPLRGVLDVQVVRADGSTAPLLDGGSAIPVGGRALAAARGESGPVLEDARVGGVHARVITVPIPDDRGGAVQVARPLTEVDRTMARLGLLLWVVAVTGVVISTLLGLAVSRAGLAPVDRLTAAAEHVARTQDLRAIIEVRGRDEIARLAASVNAMLTALDASRQRQRQLVADASHELRTPLTSLRTNIELLVRSDAHPDRTLPEPDRAALLADLSGQLQELSGLVGDLLELAGDEAGVEAVEDLQLDHLVRRAVERARLRAPGLRFEVELEPCGLRGRRRSLERAVTNVLDNAIKWSPPDGVVEVTLCCESTRLARHPDHGIRTGDQGWGDGGAQALLRVQDHGAGIGPEDLPLVFDRFHRASSARHLPGSGLGLAIVREAVESHGGTATIDSAPGKGTAVLLRLPATRPATGG